VPAREAAPVSTLTPSDVPALPSALSINYHALIFIRVSCDDGRFTSPMKPDVEIPLRLMSY
jgi:hypothetical protein